MKRFFFTVLFALVGVTAGLSVAAADTAPVIGAFAGSYAVNLISYQAPSEGAEPVAVFYGRLELTSTAAGAATGTLRTKAGKSYSIKTKLVVSGSNAVASDAHGQNNVGAAQIKGLPIYAINFSVTITPSGEVTVSGLNGALGDAGGLFYSDGTLRFVAFTGKNGDVPAWVGNYTLALISPEPAGIAIPAGAGYASLVVAANGTLTFKGKLGDGSPLSGTAKADANGNYSLFTTPPGYAAGGYFTADINLNTRGAQAESAIWNKAAKAADKAYPAGFSTTVQVVVQPWLVPAKKAYPIAAALGFGSSKNFNVTFSSDGLSDGDYTATLPDTLRLTGAAKLQAVAGGVGAPAENNSKEWDNVWKVSVNPLTGVFTGKMLLKHVVGSATVVRNVPVEGVLSLPAVLSNAVPFAYGQYVVKPKATDSTTVSGLVTFSGPLENNVGVATSGSYTSVAVLDLPDANDLVTEPKPALPSSIPSVVYKEYTGFHTGERRAESTIKFTIAEDLQSITFAGKVLPVQGGVPALGNGPVVYSNGPKSPTNSITVFVVRNSTTGAVEGYEAIFTQLVGFSVRTITAGAGESASSSWAKPFTSITKL